MSDKELQESLNRIFADGFYFERRDNAPGFVVGNLSVKVDKAVPLMQEHVNEKGYINFQIKIGRSGKHYIEVDTWEPQQPNYSGTAKQPEPHPVVDKESWDQSDDIPF